MKRIIIFLICMSVFISCEKLKKSNSVINAEYYGTNTQISGTLQQKIKKSIEEVEYYYFGPLVNWYVFRVAGYPGFDSRKIIIINTSEDFSDNYAEGKYTWIFVCEKDDILQKVCSPGLIDEYVVKDLTCDGDNELVIWTSDRRNMSLEILKFEKGKLLEIGSFGGYRRGPTTAVIDGKCAVIEWFDVTMGEPGPDHVYEPVVHVWNGEKFAKLKDEFIEAIDKYGTDNNFFAQLKYMGILEKIAGKRTGDFDVIYNMREVAQQLNNKKKIEKYTNELINAPVEEKFSEDDPRYMFENELNRNKIIDFLKEE